MAIPGSVFRRAVILAIPVGATIVFGVGRSRLGAKLAAWLPLDRSRWRRLLQWVKPSFSARALLDLPSGITAADLRRWDLDVWRFSERELLQIVAGILRDAGVLAAFTIELPTLAAFLSDVAAHYHPHNPYHNLAHAVTVMHASYVLMRGGHVPILPADAPAPAARFVGVKTERGEVSGEALTEAEAAPEAQPGALSSLHRLALLLAALCHDVDHPGVSNAFLLGTASPLAIRYHGASVLEKHHADNTFRLLRRHSLLASLNTAEHDELHRVVGRAILGTDMAAHKQSIAECATLTASGRATDASALLSAILHLSDLSNAVLCWPLCHRWGMCVCDEFRQQAARERAAGIPETPHMAKLDTQREITELQVGFFDFVVTPLWSAAAGAFPAVRERMAQLEANRNSWAEEGQAATL